MHTTNPPRENLVRALSESPTVERDKADDGPVLRGHFAVWDTWTEINSIHEGHFLERFTPGSMTKTITEGQERMRVLFQHGKDPQIADKPLGTIQRLEPDDTGAYYEVRMFDTSYNRDLLPGLKAGVYGASHRFRVVAEEFDHKPKRSDHNPDGIPERTVTEARVFEFGPVTWGAYPSATSGVRSMTDEYLFGRYVDDPERLAELLAYERQLRGGQPKVTVTYGNSFGATTASTSTTEAAETAAVEDTEPERSDATTPNEETPAATVEPEASEPTTRAPGASITPISREEFLECISRT